MPPNPQLPEGVQRYRVVGEQFADGGAAITPSPDGDLVHVTDILAIEAKARKEERERLTVEVEKLFSKESQGVHTWEFGFREAKDAVHGLLKGKRNE